MKNEKIILRNDPAKKRKTKCRDCEKEYDFDPIDPTTVYNDMIDYITQRKEWEEHPSPTVCIGMLHAVLDSIYVVAPSKEQAEILIIEVLRKLKVIREKS